MNDYRDLEWTKIAMHSNCNCYLFQSLFVDQGRLAIVRTRKTFMFYRCLLLLISNLDGRCPAAHHPFNI